MFLVSLNLNYVIYVSKEFGLRTYRMKVEKSISYLSLVKLYSKMSPPTFVKDFHYKHEMNKLKYVKFGNTGLKVSVLGFGAACFGSHYGDYTFNDAKYALTEALKHGINYIDTAPFYGDGKSEDILGRILQDVPRSAYYLATKVGRYSDDPSRAFDFSCARVTESFNKSLERLRLDYVDVIQVHDIEFAPSIDIIVNETLPALYKIVQEGKAKFIGITGYPLSKLLEVIQKSQTKIDVVLSYARMTLMDDTLNDYLHQFKEKGLAVVHASPTALGLLTNQSSWPWHPGNILHRELCLKAGQYCMIRNLELGNLAVNYTLSQPGVDLHLIGMPNIEVVRTNLNILANGISAEEKKVTNEIFERFFKPSDKRHWENIEVNKYKEDLKILQLGKSV